MDLLRDGTRTFRAKDGSDVLVRRAVPDDAPGILEVLGEAIDDGDFTVRTREEMRDVPGERAHVEARSADPSALLLVAVRGPQIVGELSFSSGDRRRLAHRGTFGISVRRDARGVGIGSVLIETLLEWAAAHPVIEKVCLGVYPDNARGLALYTKLGFVEEGRLVRDVRFGPGRYKDTIEMYRMVKPPQP